MPVVALPRKVSLGMAIHTARVPQDGNERGEESAIVAGCGGRWLRGSGLFRCKTLDCEKQTTTNPSTSPLKRKTERLRSSASYGLRHTDGQPANALSGYGEHRIRDRRRRTRNTWLSDSTRLLVVLHDVGFNLRAFIHSHDRKSVEVRLLQASSVES